MYTQQNVTQVLDKNGKVVDVQSLITEYNKLNELLVAVTQKLTDIGVALPDQAAIISPALPDIATAITKVQSLQAQPAARL